MSASFENVRTAPRTPILRNLRFEIANYGTVNQQKSASGK